MALASCDQNCWDLRQCVVDSCSGEDFNTDAGRTCVETSCTDVKLLPPEVQAATLDAARCMVQCVDQC